KIDLRPLANFLRRLVLDLLLEECQSLLKLLALFERLGLLGEHGDGLLLFEKLALLVERALGSNSRRFRSHSRLLGGLEALSELGLECELGLLAHPGCKLRLLPRKILLQPRRHLCILLPLLLRDPVADGGEFLM